MTDYSKLLGPKSIRRIVVSGLIEDAARKPVTMSIDRCEPVEVGKDKIKLMPADTLLRSADNNQHEPSTSEDTTEPHPIESPIQSSYELHLSIGKELGSGNCGSVFRVKLKFLKDLADPDGKKIQCSGLPFLPSRLVLKVAEEQNIMDLGREALNYMKLAVLQGASLPRFYGLFNSEVDNDWRFPGVNEKNRTRTHELSVMLIERTGGRITLKESDNDLIDIRDVLADITFEGMEQRDVRSENIRKVPPSGLPVKRCPTHNRRHKYWVIDLEQVYETTARGLAWVHYYYGIEDMYGFDDDGNERDVRFVLDAVYPESDIEAVEQP